jgi:hypothetical protein
MRFIENSFRNIFVNLQKCYVEKLARLNTKFNVDGTRFVVTGYWESSQNCRQQEGNFHSVPITVYWSANCRLLNQVAIAALFPLELSILLVILYRQAHTAGGGEERKRNESQMLYYELLRNRSQCEVRRFVRGSCLSRIVRGSCLIRIVRWRCLIRIL